MCVVKKPHIPKPSEEDQKDPPILRNPILDGMLGNIAALRGGSRNAFRIDLLNPLSIPVGGGSGLGGGGGGNSGGTGGAGSGSSGTTATSGFTGGTQQRFSKLDGAPLR